MCERQHPGRMSGELCCAEVHTVLLLPDVPDGALPGPPPRHALDGAGLSGTRKATRLFFKWLFKC